MDFILYFLLRRFFVTISVSPDRILLSRGLLLRRVYDIPVAAVIRAEFRSTLLLRLLRGRRVTLHTLSGRAVFYLRKDEKLDFLCDIGRYPPIKPRLSARLAAAFAQTKALGGAVLFSAAIVRLGNILGSGYYNALFRLIADTAAGVDKLLSSLRLALPKITAALAVFAAAAWVFAFVRNLIKYSRFIIYPSRKAVAVRHGIFTLYETVVVPNNLNAAIKRDTPATLLMGAAPLFCGSSMIFPPLCRQKHRKAIRLLFSVPCEKFSIKPLAVALFGHIVLPLGWGGFFAALLVLTYISGSDPVLRTLLWGGVWICLWLCFVFGAYMHRSGCGSCGESLLLCARSGTQLLTVYAPKKSCAYLRYDSNPFQRKSHTCDMRFYISGATRLRLRNISEPW